MGLENNVFLKNRMLLISLIYSLEEFTEEQLVRKFRKVSNGNMALDGGQRVKDYLQELTKIDTLKYEFDYYRVQ